MKTTWPPLQCIRVGLESNQQGQAASHEHASSRAPLTFQGVFFSSASDPRVKIKKRAVAISERNRMEPPLSFSWRQAYRQRRSAGRYVSCCKFSGGPYGHRTVRKEARQETSVQTARSRSDGPAGNERGGGCGGRGGDDGFHG